MYRTCIFCSKDLGSNEAIEHFPVGSRVAFDSFKGRLWAVCPRCTRWNLAPIEERWEAVEEAERIFHDSRMRVQSENIGMAKLRDGTRLIRIGSALPGELAAWRYGTQLVKRRTNTYMVIGASAVAAGAVMAGLPFFAGVAVPFTMVQSVASLTHGVMRNRAANRVVLQLEADQSPTGRPLTLRRKHLIDARLDSAGGSFALSIPESPVGRDRLTGLAISITGGSRLLLTGAHAQLVAARTMVDKNARGASPKEVASALEVLADAGSAQAYLEKLMRKRPTIDSPSKRNTRTTLMNASGDITYPIGRTDGLALEMALHDESERRALEGELDLLEDAWREAEQIARIADALPGEIPE